ncbi:hypothetical protein E2C01_063729 [Portunus trituberculatus]|uniref:Uncharacterized protein n=1 Tax=Portunus trituberculatus TaxID=210409 RepID=A0A5B7HH57_PORTR|nr:hypothetical protein [Portunus trituberculatus]
MEAYLKAPSLKTRGRAVLRLGGCHAGRAGEGIVAASVLAHFPLVFRWREDRATQRPDRGAALGIYLLVCRSGPTLLTERRVFLSESSLDLAIRRRRS